MLGERFRKKKMAAAEGRKMWFRVDLSGKREDMNEFRRKVH